MKTHTNSWRNIKIRDDRKSFRSSPHSLPLLSVPFPFQSVLSILVYCFFLLSICCYFEKVKHFQSVSVHSLFQYFWLLNKKVKIFETENGKRGGKSVQSKRNDWTNAVFMLWIFRWHWMRPFPFSTVSALQYIPVRNHRNPIHRSRAPGRERDETSRLAAGAKEGRLADLTERQRQTQVSIEYSSSFLLWFSSIWSKYAFAVVTHTYLPIAATRMFRVNFQHQSERLYFIKLAKWYCIMYTHSYLEYMQLFADAIHEFTAAGAAPSAGLAAGRARRSRRGMYTLNVKRIIW